MAVLEEKMINGRKEISFNPDPKMLLFAYAVSCDKKYIGLAPEDVLPELGLRRDLWSRWQRDYNPYFEEWLEGVMMTFRGTNVKKMLEFVGLQRAFQGEFNYWKAFALRERVINPDQLNHGLIPATLGVFSEWDQGQVEQHCNTLLEALRGPGEGDPALAALHPVEDEGGGALAGAAPRGGSEVHPRGAATVLEESVALAQGLGADGERTPYELEPF
jgi:hypothetical protein